MSNSQKRYQIITARFDDWWNSNDHPERDRYKYEQAWLEGAIAGLQAEKEVALKDMKHQQERSFAR